MLTVTVPLGNCNIDQHHPSALATWKKNHSMQTERTGQRVKCWKLEQRHFRIFFSMLF